jgi:NitT/TauT family transport system ATP-binding protein
MVTSQTWSLASRDSQSPSSGPALDRSASSEPAPEKVLIEKLHKTYISNSGRTVALQDVNLTIGQDEFIALVGPSGCGKSTLLRVISALVRPSKGRVVINGVALTKPSNEIGIVFQEPVLLPWRSVLDNVLLPAEILRLDVGKARTRARDLLNMVGLSGFEACYPGELSGGMQQRAAICRALIHKPTMLLMDEPFAALDAMTREELGLELLRIWAADKKTIVFVTHNINEAILLSDRVVAMSPRPGRISEIITVDLPRPRTLDMEFLPKFKSYSDRVRATIGHV